MKTTSPFYLSDIFEFIHHSKYGCRNLWEFKHWSLLYQLIR
jgi:hypothetical protein